MEILSITKYTNANAIEVVWGIVHREIVLVEKKSLSDTGEIIKTQVEKESVFHEIVKREAFSDNEESLEILRSRLVEFETPLTNEQEAVIQELIANRHILTEEEQLAESVRLNAERIKSIKEKAGEIINSRYPVYFWQINHPRLDPRYSEQYAWIDSIRAISDEAEESGTLLGDIYWGIE